MKPWTGAAVRSFSKPDASRVRPTGCFRQLGRDLRSRHRRFRQGSEARRRFLSAHRELSGKGFRSRRIPGGYFKREGRPSERETLISRLIDRPIRPLFPDGYRNDTQVVVTVLSHDLETDPDILSMVAASAALTLSGVPSWVPLAAPASASSRVR